MIKMKDLTLEEAQLLWDLGMKSSLRFKYVSTEDGGVIGLCYLHCRPREFNILPEWTRVYMLKVEDEEDNA